MLRRLGVGLRMGLGGDRKEEEGKEEGRERGVHWREEGGV